MQHIANVSHRTEDFSLLVQASHHNLLVFSQLNLCPHIITIILAEFRSLPALSGLGAKSISTPRGLV